jgi:hypothetical protein
MEQEPNQDAAYWKEQYFLAIDVMAAIYKQYGPAHGRSLPLETLRKEEPVMSRAQMARKLLMGSVKRFVEDESS